MSARPPDADDELDGLLAALGPPAGAAPVASPAHLLALAKPVSVPVGVPRWVLGASVAAALLAGFGGGVLAGFVDVAGVPGERVADVGAGAATTQSEAERRAFAAGWAAAREDLEARYAEPSAAPAPTAPSRVASNYPTRDLAVCPPTASQGAGGPPDDGDWAPAATLTGPASGDDGTGFTIATEFTDGPELDDATDLGDTIEPLPVRGPRAGEPSSPTPDASAGRVRPEVRREGAVADVRGARRPTPWSLAFDGGWTATKPPGPPPNAGPGSGPLVAVSARVATAGPSRVHLAAEVGAAFVTPLLPIPSGSSIAPRATVEVGLLAGESVTPSVGWLTAAHLPLRGGRPDRGPPPDREPLLVTTGPRLGLDLGKRDRPHLRLRLDIQGEPHRAAELGLRPTVALTGGIEVPLGGRWR